MDKAKVITESRNGLRFVWTNGAPVVLIHPLDKVKVVTERNGLRFVWTTGAEGECNVDVYEGDKLVAERVYPKRGSVADTAAFYSDVIFACRGEIKSDASSAPSAPSANQEKAAQ